MPDSTFVTLCQPMARTHTAYLSVHDYREGPSLLHPGDFNWEAPFDLSDGGSAVVFEAGNLPPASTVRVVTYASNRTRCSVFRPGDAGYNGERLIADIWVAPFWKGTLRAERYLGYGVYQHLQFPVSGEFRLVANGDGFARAILGLVFGDANTTSEPTCWTGPHVHHVASRDIAMEQTDGTYTTGIKEEYSSGTERGLKAGSPTFSFAVNWDS